MLPRTVPVRLALLACLLPAAVAAWAQPAAAATVAAADGVLTYTAAARERNAPVLTVAADGRLAVDDAVALAATGACAPDPAVVRRVLCEAPERLEIRTGDNVDRVEIDAAVTAEAVVWDGTSTTSCSAAGAA
jgi:hypothetical protein